MKEKSVFTRYVYLIGLVAFVAGTLDPLEGSVLIAAGCALLSWHMYITKDSYFKLFLLNFILITVGVFFLFYFSSLGGFGGNSSLSLWWGTLILPYPIGWLLSVIFLIIRAIKLRKKIAY